MRGLTHYIIVRRDLSFGMLLAMVAHAAGESFYKLACPDSSGSERPESNREVGSSPLPRGSINPSETIAIILGARNEGRLSKAADTLKRAGVPFVEIREVDGEFAGQLMAIGILPGDKELISPLVNDFHMLREPQP